MRVGIYARVSTDGQEARGTIGSQLEALRARVATDGDELVGEYIDDGVSGARLDRPGLDALRDAAEAGLIEALWCLTPDRLSRSYAYQVLITDELARHGVPIRYLDAPDVATDPQARLLTQVQAVIAEYERAKITERSRRGKLFRARAGEAVCWRAPYGYLRVPRTGDRPAHLVINEEQAAVVRRIFDDYVAGGRSIRQITCGLNDANIPSAAGGRWSTGTVGRMLRREVYVGCLYLNRTKMEPHPGRPARQVRRPREEWVLVALPGHHRRGHFRGCCPSLRREHQLLRPPSRPQRRRLAAARSRRLRLRRPPSHRPRPRWHQQHPHPLLRMPLPRPRPGRPRAPLPRRQHPGRRPR